ncbi:MAG: pseudaminic acid cytidylyltransferase [Bacteroidota bacterium]
MKKIAIIPARGGSKRIPRKNIKNFLGKPIISYSIEAAINSELFDEIMVSTDDEEIAEIALKFGANVPFMRSRENADDHSTTVDVILEVLQNYNKQKVQFDFGCCIYPTAPFVKTDHLKQGWELLISKGFSTVFPTVEYSYPIWRSLEVKNQRVNMIWPEYYKSRSQDLKVAYHDAGQWYWFKKENLQENPILLSNESGSIVLSNLEVQDIDNESDWTIAELKYNHLINKGDENKDKSRRQQ